STTVEIVNRALDVCKHELSSLGSDAPGSSGNSGAKHASERKDSDSQQDPIEQLSQRAKMSVVPEMDLSRVTSDSSMWPKASFKEILPSAGECSVDPEASTEDAFADISALSNEDLVWALTHPDTVAVVRRLLEDRRKGPSDPQHPASVQDQSLSEINHVQRSITSGGQSIASRDQSLSEISQGKESPEGRMVPLLYPLLVLLASLCSSEAKGCMSFGHSCFGGHGKRTDPAFALDDGGMLEMPPSPGQDDRGFESPLSQSSLMLKRMLANYPVEDIPNDVDSLADGPRRLGPLFGRPRSTPDMMMVPVPITRFVQQRRWERAAKSTGELDGSSAPHASRQR
ncbi:unnamed protein product, partial [Cyprideis torosa]